MQPTAWRQGVQFLSEPLFMSAGEAGEGGRAAPMVAHATMDPLSGDLEIKVK